MYLEELPGVLAWAEESPVLTTLHAKYIVLLDRRLDELCRRVAAADPQLAEVTRSAVVTLGEDGAARVLCHPEVSYRLLWPTHHDDADAALFVASVASGVADPVGRDPLSNPVLVGYSGSVLGTAGEELAPWSLAASLPLDCSSPFALTADVAGTSIRLDRPAPPLDVDQLLVSVSRTAEAARAIEVTVPAAWSMVARFTKSLMLLPDAEARTQFSSGSSGQFVGRSVLANPHLDKVRVEHIAEAIVHEAIHSVLYMDEQHDPWVLDPELYAGPMRIDSPWTGNPLPLRPYLQACFVWYGLLGFWSAALGKEPFDRDVVRERLHVATSGFLRGDLTGRLGDVSSHLSPEVTGAVSELQQMVVSWFPVAVPAGSGS